MVLTRDDLRKLHLEHYTRVVDTIELNARNSAINGRTKYTHFHTQMTEEGLAMIRGRFPECVVTYKGEDLTISWE